MELNDWSFYWGIGIGFRKVDDDLFIVLPFFILIFDLE